MLFLDPRGGFFSQPRFVLARPAWQFLNGPGQDNIYIVFFIRQRRANTAINAAAKRASLMRGESLALIDRHLRSPRGTPAVHTLSVLLAVHSRCRAAHTPWSYYPEGHVVTALYTASFTET